MRKGIFTTAILGASSASGAPNIGDVLIAPSGPTNSESVFLTAAHPEVTGVLVSNFSNCSGSIFQPVSRPIEYRLPQRNSWNYFYTRTTTDSGEASDCVAQEVLHDDLVPQINSLEGPSGYVDSGSALIGFSVDDGVNGSGIENVECQIDQQAWFGCASPVSLAGLSEGEHRFAVRSTDLAGNVSATSELVWSVDLTNPIVVIHGGPDDNGLVRFTGDDGIQGSGVERFVCSIDGQPSVGCESPFSVGVLAPGSHSLTVLAIDRVGRSSGFAKVSWDVEAPPPAIEVKITGITGPNDSKVDSYFNGSTEPWINLATSGSIDSMKVLIVGTNGKIVCVADKLLPQQVVKFSKKCRLQNGFTYSALAEVRGQGVTATTSFEFVVDVKKPRVEVTKASKREGNDVVFDFFIKDETPVTAVECVLTGPKSLQIIRNCMGLTEMTYSGLSEGRYQFFVRAQDSVDLTKTSNVWTFYPSRIPSIAD